MFPFFLSFVAHGGVGELWQIMYTISSTQALVEGLAILVPPFSIILGYHLYKVGVYYRLPTLKLATAAFVLENSAALPLFSLVQQLSSYLSETYNDLLVQAIHGNPNPMPPSDYYQHAMAFINPIVSDIAVMGVFGLVFAITLSKGLAGIRKWINRREIKIGILSTTAGMIVSAIIATVSITGSGLVLDANFSLGIWLAVLGAVDGLSTLIGLVFFAFGLDGVVKQEEKRLAKLAAKL